MTDTDADMRRLKQGIIRMGGLVEEMLGAAVEALATHDIALARRAIAMDHAVNALEIEIDEQCLHLLARGGLSTADLRFTAMSMKLVTDIERMGDLVGNICDRIIELHNFPRIAAYVDLPKMAAVVRSMINDVLDAFVAMDVNLAREVCARDRLVDELHWRIYADIDERMAADPAAARPGMRLMFITKYLERLGDHATNVAETVVFLVEGRDIRHTSSASSA